MTSKCNRCYQLLSNSLFNIKKDGNITKTCTECSIKVSVAHKKHRCIHNKQKSRCIDCCGVGICEHKRQKNLCKDCKGISVCKHGKRKYRCKDCCGSAICKHGIIKYQCKKCKGGSVCDHNKIRSQCVECKGGGICKHNNIRNYCKDCGNKGHCKHNVKKSQCIYCHPEHSCLNCKSIYVPKTRKFYPHCFRCYCILNPGIEIPRKYMMKEHHIRTALKTEFPNINLVFNKSIGGCSQKRPDVRIECLTHTVIIECDENQHKYTLCEDKRMMELFQDLGNRPLIMIRFNPDEYIVDNIKGGCFTYTKTGILSVNKKEFSTRIGVLIEKIQFHMKNIPNKEITLEKLYYD
jgi:hypothetical protein